MSGYRFAIGAACVVAIAQAPADAQVEAAVGSVGTGMLVKQIGDELRQTLDKATASGDFLSMRASQEALYVLDAFKATSGDVMNVAFDKIGKERQAVLNGVRERLQAIEDGRVDTLARLEGTTDQIDRLVRETTFKSYPVIYRFRGGLVTPGETQNVVLTISGYKLARAGAPYVTFRNTRYPAQVIGENLRFELPRGLFTAEPANIKSETARLNLTYEAGGFFGYFATKRAASYDLNIITLPKQLATVEIKYTQLADEVRQDVWDREEHYRRSGRGGWDCHSYAYSPKTAERRFDVNATSVTALSGNGNGRLEDVRIRDVGISFRICARRRLWDRGPGFRHAAVHATETWTETVDKPYGSTADLTWTGDLALSTPEKIKDLIVTAKDFTGNRRTVTAAGGDAGRYVRVRYDRDSNVVIVTPIVPAELNAL